MKKTVAMKWVKALRSGKYKQAYGKLCAKDPQSGKKVAHCCLGVLCEISPYRSRYMTMTVNKSYSKGVITPVLVATWAGLSNPDPVVSIAGGDKISALNDTGCKFNEIADLIEKEYKKL